jgi:hypothetical protein
MLQNLIDSYEKIKKYVYIVDRGDRDPIIIRFDNEHFYHLLGLHYTNLDMFFPKNMISKDKRYKHMKNNIEKYENMIINQAKRKDTLQLRINTFSNIIRILEDNKTVLYNLKYHTPDSLYKGTYGLANIYESIYCLLGLKVDESKEQYLHVPQSWMADRRPNVLIEHKPAKKIKKIVAIPKEAYVTDSVWAILNK